MTARNSNQVTLTRGEKNALDRLQAAGRALMASEWKAPKATREKLQAAQLIEVFRSGRRVYSRFIERTPLTVAPTELTFGIELEFNNISRYQAAQTLASVVNGVVTDKSRSYGSYWVTAPDGRKWAVVYDGSVEGPAHEKCEIVSPILTAADFITVRKIIRALRAAGAKAHASCGMHVHVGAAPLMGEALQNLFNHHVANEDAIYSELGITDRRANSYCRKPSHVYPRGQRVNGATRGEVSRQVAGISRYCGFNLQSMSKHGTVEFRYFNSTLNCLKFMAHMRRIQGWCNDAIAQARGEHLAAA